MPKAIGKKLEESFHIKFGLGSCGFWGFLETLRNNHSWHLDQNWKKWKLLVIHYFTT